MGMHHVRRLEPCCPPDCPGLRDHQGRGTQRPARRGGLFNHRATVRQCFPARRCIARANDLDTVALLAATTSAVRRCHNSEGMAPSAQRDHKPFDECARHVPIFARIGMRDENEVHVGTMVFDAAVVR